MSQCKFTHTLSESENILASEQGYCFKLCKDMVFLLEHPVHSLRSRMTSYPCNKYEQINVLQLSTRDSTYKKIQLIPSPVYEKGLIGGG